MTVFNTEEILNTFISQKSLDILFANKTETKIVFPSVEDSMSFG